MSDPTEATARDEDDPSPRFRGFSAHDLSAEQAELQRELLGGSRGSGEQAFSLQDEAGALTGPFGLMLLAPEIGAPLQRLGAAVRFSGALSDREREIAILAVGSRLQSEFEVWAHRAVAASIGVSGADIDALCAGEYLPATARERCILEFVRRTLSREPTTEEWFAEANSVLNRSEIYELLVLIGYYALLANTMEVFGIGAPEAAGGRGRQPGVRRVRG